LELVETNQETYVTTVRKLGTGQGGVKRKELIPKRKESKII
jgi:hypothetical protein